MNNLHQTYLLQDYKIWMDRVIDCFEGGGRNISKAAYEELKTKRDYCNQRLVELRG